MPSFPEADFLVVHPGWPLRGEAYLPGDKSLSHRAALLAAMAEGESCIENFLVSGVTQAMLEALTELGVSWRLDGTTLSIQGVGLGVEGASPVRQGVTLNCGNSATTLRLLAGALSAWGAPVVLDGSPGLRRRPMQRIVDPLQQMGVAIETTNGGAPLILRPGSRPLHSITYAMPVASAQVKSCILLAALAAGGPTTVTEPGPSRDHTERMLGAMGVTVTNRQPGDDSPAWGEVDDTWATRLVPSHPLRLTPLHLTLPGDQSAAAFLMVAALVTPGSQVRLRGVGMNPTRTGLLDTLQAMGGDIQVEVTEEQGGEPVGDILVRHSTLHGVEVSGDLVVRMIDEFPVFAVAAAYAEGTTLVRDAQELRHKESDRISVLGNELRRLDIDFCETPDGFIIQGGKPVGGLGGFGESPAGGGADFPVGHSNGDHRIAMSLAVAGLAAAGPVGVAGAGMIHESFPGFVQTLQALGADLTLQKDVKRT